MKARLGREESHLDIDDTTRPDLGSIDTGAIVEAGDITDEGSVQSVVVNAPENAELMLSGDFEAVGVDSPNVTVQLTRGMVKDLINNEKLEVKLGEESEVDTLTLNTATAVTGGGNVKQVFVNTNGSILETKPAEVVMNGDVVIVIDGDEVTESTEYPAISGVLTFDEAFR